jgi:hypothetical protein
MFQRLGGIKEERSPGSEWVRWGQWKEEQREETWRNRHARSRESVVLMSMVHGNTGACHHGQTPMGEGDQVQVGQQIDVYHGRDLCWR